MVSTSRAALTFLRIVRAAMTTLVLLASSCSRRAPEPEATKERVASRHEEPEISWSAPASWTLEKAADKGLYRAKYIVPAQGNAPNPAEVLVSRIGTGDATGLDAPLGELHRSFEGPKVGAAVKSDREVKGFLLRVLEVEGTYKYPMGPRLKNRPVAEVMKEGWRAIAVGVRAPSGALWFFRLVGPSDAVESARSPFLAMLDGLNESAAKP